MKKFITDFLFINAQTGNISTTKFWSNVGSAIMCGGFAYMVYKGTASTELWFVFGALVMGNSTANKILNFKYGQGATKSTTEDK